MSVAEKVNMVVKDYMNKLVVGDWDGIMEMVGDIQGQFVTDLHIECFGLFDTEEGTTEVYNKDSELLLTLYYNPEADSSFAGKLYKVDIKYTTLYDMVHTMECPLCRDGEMEHEPVENPRAMGEFHEKRVTHVYICDTCPAVMMEYHTDTDSQKLHDHLNQEVR